MHMDPLVVVTVHQHHPARFRRTSPSSSPRQLVQVRMMEASKVPALYIVQCAEVLLKGHDRHLLQRLVHSQACHLIQVHAVPVHPP